MINLLDARAIDAAARSIFYDMYSITHDEGGKRWNESGFKSVYRAVARDAIKAAQEAITARDPAFGGEEDEPRHNPDAIYIDGH